MKRFASMLGVLLPSFLYLSFASHTYADLLPITPNPPHAFDKITFRFEGCSSTDIQVGKPMFAFRQDEATKGWNGNVGRFEGNIAVMEWTIEFADKYFIKINCQGDGKQINQQNEPNFTSYQGDFVVEKESSGTGKIILTGPSGEIKKDANITFKVSEIQSCTETGNKATLITRTKIGGGAWQDVKKTPFTFGESETWDIPYKAELPDPNKPIREAFISCGVNVDSPKLKSNTVNFTILSNAAETKAQTSPQLTIEPSTPEVKQSVTLTATNLNESGCKEGAQATFFWHNTDAYSTQATQSNKALFVEKNKVTYVIPDGFDDKQQVEIYLKCKKTDGSESEAFPHLLITPKDHVKAPRPSPPPAPCEVKDQGTKSTKAGETELCISLNTAIGTIELEPSKLISSILRLLLGFSGMIALLIIIRSGYQLIASQGNPEKVKEAREAITSAVVGLLFTVFSLVILQVIGVDILQLPGFTP